MIRFDKIMKADSPVLLHLKMKAIPMCLSHYSEDDVSKWITYCESEDPVSCFAQEKGFLATLNSEPIGFVTYTVSNQKLSVDNLFSLKSKSSYKIGQNLLQLAEKEIQKSNIIGDVFIRSTLNAVSFYKRYGYEYIEDITSRAGFLAHLLKKTTHHPS